MKKILVLLILSLALASCNNSSNLQTKIESNNSKETIITSSIVPISSIVNDISDSSVKTHTIVPV
jgi:ABC-type Zn uptake system ZnuABC Zn-binding protein ZnuA